MQASSEVAGRGTVVIVEVESGAVQVGDTIRRRGGLAAEVTGVEVFADDPEEGGDPVLQLGLLLVGIGKENLPPGSGLESQPAPGAPEG